MSNFNRIVLVGNIAEKPDTKFGMENGSSMSKFTLKVERPARQDGTVDVDFIPVLTWGKLSDYTAEYLDQDCLVAVEGRIQVRSLEEAGQRNWITEVVASSVKLLEAKTANMPIAEENNKEKEITVGENPFVGESTVTEDDVPF